MRKASAAKPKQRSEEAILDQAIQQLLSATKDEAKKKGKPLEREKLRKDGYSERFIERSKTRNALRVTDHRLRRSRINSLTLISSKGAARRARSKACECDIFAESTRTI